jgi:hypothetical protein
MRAFIREVLCACMHMGVRESAVYASRYSLLIDTHSTGSRSVVMYVGDVAATIVGPATRFVHWSAWIKRECLTQHSPCEISEFLTAAPTERAARRLASRLTKKQPLHHRRVRA